MVNRVYEVIFEVTETCQNGNERRHKVSVYAPIFKDGRHVVQLDRVEKCTAALKEQHYYDIEYIETKTKVLITAGF